MARKKNAQRTTNEYKPTREEKEAVKKLLKEIKKNEEKAKSQLQLETRND